MRKAEESVSVLPERAQVMPERPLPEPDAGPRPAWRLSRPCLVPALASGLLLWLCYFPVDWAWLGWVALVPLLCLVRSEARPRNVYWSAWAAGLVFFLPALQWMRVADYRMYATWLMLAVYCSLYFPAAVFLVRRLDRRTGLPLIVSLPVVWTALELLRTYLISGFPWYYLGHTQHDFLTLIQISDVTGAYGVTFLVAAVNALAFEALYRRRGLRTFLNLPAEVPQRPWVLSVQAAVVVLLLGLTLGYGAWRLGQEHFSAGPRVALLQSSLDQRIRNFAAIDEDAGKTTRASYEELCQRAVKAGRPDVIVWPETSFPGTWYELAPELPRDRIPPSFLQRLDQERAPFLKVAGDYRTNVILGVSTVVLESGGHETRYNSALLVAPDQRVLGRYDKIHRVPFGEYVPLRDTLPFMNELAPYDNDYSITPGAGQFRLPLKTADGRTYHFGVLICYEDTDPNLARRFARADGGEPPADFLINISNDGWFNGTSEHEEHLAICRFRAVESRRPVARAVNMGISAVIDGSGRVLRPETAGGERQVADWRIDGPTDAGLAPGRWHEFKKVEGVLTARIPLDGRTSLYAAWGDWLAVGCWLVLALGFAWPLVRRALSVVSRAPAPKTA